MCTKPFKKKPKKTDQNNTDTNLSNHDVAQELESKPNEEEKASTCREKPKNELKTTREPKKAEVNNLKKPTISTAREKKPSEVSSFICGYFVGIPIPKRIVVI